MKISILTTLLCAFASTATAGPGFPCLVCGNTVTITTTAVTGANSSTFTNGSPNSESVQHPHTGASVTIGATNGHIACHVFAEVSCESGVPGCPTQLTSPISFVDGTVWDTVRFLTPGVSFVRVTYNAELTATLTGPPPSLNSLEMFGIVTVNSTTLVDNESSYGGTCCSSTAVVPVGPNMYFELGISANPFAVADGNFTTTVSGDVSAGISFVALDGMQNPIPNVVYTTLSGQPQAISNGTWEPTLVAIVPWNEPYVPALSSDHGALGPLTVHSPSNRLYVTMNGSTPHIEVLDLAGLAVAGEIPDVNANGVVVSSQSMHGFSSSNPIVMWDVDSLRVQRTIPLAANIVPGAIVLDSQNDLVYLFHQEAPLATILRASDGSIVTDITLDGIAKEAVTDSKGNIYAGMQNSDEYFADVLGFGVNGAPAVTDRWTLRGGSSCAGLAIDSANAILFATCKPTASTDHSPAQWMAFQSGKIIPNSIIPVFNQAKAAVFNPDTHQLSSLQIDGTMTIIKEQSPTIFFVENLIQASPIPPTSLTLDPRTARLYLTGEQAPSTDATSGALFVLGK